MQAAVFQGVHQISMETLPLPKAGFGEVVIQVKACGICGTDQHIYHGHPGSAEVTAPMILGHELAGEIVEVGPGVEMFQVGTRVTVDPNVFCGTCRFCRSGREHLCEDLRAIGVTRNGGMAEFCCVPAENVYALPDSLSDEEGALVEPLGCCLHGIDRVHIDSTDRVAIVGAGFIGLLMTQLVETMCPAALAIIEPSPEKRDMAEKFGATQTLTPDDARALDGEFDVVIECVGRPESMQLALDLAGRGGRVLLFGVASPDAAVSMKPFSVFQKELTIMGSFINPNTHQRAIELLNKRRIQVRDLVSHRFRLNEIADVMSNYADLSVTKGLIVL